MDQDLSVIVAEIINDDDVKQRLVPIVFSRERPMYTKEQIVARREPHKLMLKTWRTLETRLIVQQCAQQHMLPTMVACRPKRGRHNC